MLLPRAVAVANHFADDHQPLAPFIVDAKTPPHAVARKPTVGFVHGGLDILRIAIDPPHDNHVLEPPGDEQLAVEQEPQVARAQKWTPPSVFARSRVKCLFGQISVLFR